MAGGGASRARLAQRKRRVGAVGPPAALLGIQGGPDRRGFPMSISQALLPEFDQEMTTTRRLLERVPSDKGARKPHPKSFPMRHLAQLVATMPGWMTTMLRATQLDLAQSPTYTL